MTHHGDEHVDEDDDDDNVIEGEEEHSDAFHEGGAVRRRLLRDRLLLRVRHEHTVDVDETEHRPEEAEQRVCHPEGAEIVRR